MAFCCNALQLPLQLGFAARFLSSSSQPDNQPAGKQTKQEVGMASPNWCSCVTLHGTCQLACLLCSQGVQDGLATGCVLLSHALARTGYTIVAMHMFS